MQFRKFDLKVQSFSLIRIFTDYYLAISKTNAIITKAMNPGSFFCLTHFRENTDLSIFL